MTESPGIAASPQPPFAMNYAVWVDRVIAAVIDTLIVIVAVIIVNIIFAIFAGALGGLAGLAGASKSEGAATALGGLGCLGCIGWMITPMIVYFVVGLWNKVWLVAKRGFSIGQGVAKLRVVLPDGNLVPVGTLILRLLVMVLFCVVPFLPLLDLLWPLWDEKRQTLHDKAVGTFVVKVPG